MAYTAITNGEIDADSPITVDLMTKMRDNPIAIANGDTGAPPIQTAAYGANSVDQAAIGASAVGQSELKSTTASQSSSISGGSAGNFAVTGGTYTMAYYLGASGTGPGASFSIVGHGSTYSATVRIANSGSTNTAYLYSRYVQASPPYDFGDGQIPLFVWMLIQNSPRKILAAEVSTDPFYVYHGPSKVASLTIPAGGNRAQVPQWMAEGFNYQQAIRTGNRAQIIAAIDRLRGDPMVEIDIDASFKNRDMAVMPHPWHDQDLTGKTVVLLDPVSDFVDDLGILHRELARSPSNDPDANIIRLLESNKIVYQTDALSRQGPPGVRIVAADWA